MKLNMTLNDMIRNEVLWNKELIQVVVENEHCETVFLSEVTRVEFLADDYDDYIIESFESYIKLVKDKDPISYIRFCLTKSGV